MYFPQEQGLLMKYASDMAALEKMELEYRKTHSDDIIQANTNEVTLSICIYYLYSTIQVIFKCIPSNFATID